MGGRPRNFSGDLNPPGCRTWSGRQLPYTVDSRPDLREQKLGTQSPKMPPCPWRGGGGEPGRAKDLKDQRAVATGVRQRSPPHPAHVGAGPLAHRRTTPGWWLRKPGFIPLLPAGEQMQEQSWVWLLCSDLRWAFILRQSVSRLGTAVNAVPSPDRSPSIPAPKA